MTGGADLLGLTAQLVDIPSVSHHEEALAGHVEGALRAVPWLEVERVGHNVVARTRLDRASRLILAGHLDTVPPNGNEKARIEGDVCWGIGAADMKAGCAVFLELARTVADPAVDLTYVFYECEEVASRFSGLRTLAAQQPELLEGDAAILGEPTGAAIEAGCQGTLRLELTLKGERAHTARPWKGRNAIHRLAPVLERCASYGGRRPVLDGCEFAEAMQAVHVEGGVAGNVVPDEARVVINHRFAPDRSVDAAVAQVREVLGDAVDEAGGDLIELVDAAEGALPGLTHPLLARLVAAAGSVPRAKLGWTDVSFFSARGIPATNFGPGDPSLAHAADERVERWELEAVHEALAGLLTAGP
ncbi:MAG TPA: succinyl-diaminopimelate desuccinylase [Acidimicrobiales bacterium]|nr:succinyl-diaminopimelate desuccinylase [Acidimicrobiales bacterium]